MYALALGVLLPSLLLHSNYVLARPQALAVPETPVAAGAGPAADAATPALAAPIVPAAAGAAPAADAATPAVAAAPQSNIKTLKDGGTYWTNFEGDKHTTGCHNLTRPTISGGATNGVGGTVLPPDGGYVAAMQGCLHNYIAGDSPGSNGFATMDCNGVQSFFAESSNYKSSADCANACNQCLSDSIAAGSRDAECFDVFGDLATGYQVANYDSEGGGLTYKPTYCRMGFSRK